MLDATKTAENILEASRPIADRAYSSKLIANLIHFLSNVGLRLLSVMEEGENNVLLVSNSDFSWSVSRFSSRTTISGVSINVWNGGTNLQPGRGYLNSQLFVFGAVIVRLVALPPNWLYSLNRAVKVDIIGVSVHSTFKLPTQMWSCPQNNRNCVQFDATIRWKVLIPSLASYKCARWVAETSDWSTDNCITVNATEKKDASQDIIVHCSCDSEGVYSVSVGISLQKIVLNHQIEYCLQKSRSFALVQNMFLPLSMVLMILILCFPLVWLSVIQKYPETDILLKRDFWDCFDRGLSQFDRHSTHFLHPIEKGFELLMCRQEDPNRKLPSHISELDMISELQALEPNKMQLTDIRSGDLPNSVSPEPESKILFRQYHLANELHWGIA